MSKTFAHLADISKWQEPYLNDGKYELLKLYGIIQKAADGLIDYTDPEGYNYKKWWKTQYDSIAHFDIKVFYHWFQTEKDAIQQAKLGLSILEKGLYVGIGLDYESYDNEISLQTALAVQIYIEYIRAGQEKKVLLYCNEWIYRALEKYLGKDWLESVDLWIAGGEYYNKELFEPLDDEIPPIVTRAKLWQYSTDGNKAADELDFGTDEDAPIDVNRFEGTPRQLYKFFGIRGYWYKIPLQFARRIYNLKLNIE